jgi:hypothetical protein
MSDGITVELANEAQFQGFLRGVSRATREVLARGTPRDIHLSIFEKLPPFSPVITGLYRASHFPSVGSPQGARLAPVKGVRGAYGPPSVGHAKSVGDGAPLGASLWISNDAGALVGGNSYAEQVENHHGVYAKAIAGTVIAGDGILNRLVRRAERAVSQFSSGFGGTL